MNEERPEIAFEDENLERRELLENLIDEDSDSDDSSEREMVSPLTVGSARPVKGEAFCDCYKSGKEKECVCGEEDTCKC